MKQFICMKWGKLYSADYVNRLYNMIERHTKPPFKLYCLTNEPEGINSKVMVLPCPSINIPEPLCYLGWRKVSLWNKAIPGLSGTFLFIDLDIIITGPLDDFFTYESTSDYLVMRNYTTPEKIIGNTSVFRFTIGSHPYVLENLLENPLEMRKRYRNSQTYVSNTIKNMAFWPDEWIKQFKVHCMRPWPLRLFMQPKEFKNAKIVVCTGNPMPHELLLGKWDAPWYKKAYKSIPPVTWVAEAWR